MNIVMILTNSFQPDMRVYKEARYLVESGRKVTILCWDRNANSKYLPLEIKENIKIVRYRYPSVPGTGIVRQLKSYLKFSMACKAYLKQNQIDFCHCHDLDGMVAFYLSGLKIPYIFDMHEQYIKGNLFRRKIIYQLLKIFIRKSKACLYVNEDQLTPFSLELKKKMYPLPNYVDPKILKPLPKTKSDVLRIGYHGMLRNQVVEFCALFEACKELKNVRIDINGGGIDLEQIETLAKKYDNVYIHGPFNGITETSDLYAHTDILFCGYDPNNINYQGNTEVVKYYEAIWTQTPMIMTKEIGMGKKVEAYRIGFAVNTRDPLQIKHVIMMLLKQREILQDFQENLKKIQHRYDWQSAVQIFDEIYEKTS